jgi:hypothetical protein
MRTPTRTRALSLTPTRTRTLTPAPARSLTRTLSLTWTLMRMRPLSLTPTLSRTLVPDMVLVVLWVLLVLVLMRIQVYFVHSFQRHVVVQQLRCRTVPL